LVDEHELYKRHIDLNVFDQTLTRENFRRANKDISDDEYESESEFDDDENNSKYRKKKCQNLNQNSI